MLWLELALLAFFGHIVSRILLLWMAIGSLLSGQDAVQDRRNCGTQLRYPIAVPGTQCEDGDERKKLEDAQLRLG